MIPLTHGLIVSAVVFSTSLIGIVVNRDNLIVLLMCVELMLLAVNTNLVLFSYYLHNIAGQIFVLFILAVAAAEAAIGLAILMLIFRHQQTINVDQLDSLQG